MIKEQNVSSCLQLGIDLIVVNPFKLLLRPSVSLYYVVDHRYVKAYQLWFILVWRDHARIPIRHVILIRIPAIITIVTLVNEWIEALHREDAPLGYGCTTEVLNQFDV